MVTGNKEQLSLEKEGKKARDKQVQELEQFNKIRNRKYNKIYKFVGKISLPGYLEGGEEEKVIN